MPSSIERRILSKDTLRAAVFTSEVIFSAAIGKKIGEQVQSAIDRRRRPNELNTSRDIKNHDSQYSGDSGEALKQLSY